MDEKNKQIADSLASGYSKADRIREYFSLVSSFVLLIWVTGLTIRHFEQSYLSFLIWGLITSYFFSDFISGFVHWFADTWGTVNTPLFGSTIIRAFREHHVDQLSITRHDFVETNGNNALITLPPLIWALSFPGWIEGGWLVFWLSFVANLCLFSLFTNQIHKWAHQETRPGWVTFLQKCKIIMSYEHHQTHHKVPFSKYYCITSGLMNPVLELSRFFRSLEWIVQKTTSHVAREDDAKIY